MALLSFRGRTFETHPALDAFPEKDQELVGKLACDIKRNGLARPITLLDGRILDGRARLRACELADVEPRFEEWHGTGNPAVWLFSTQTSGPTYNKSQLAIVVAQLRDEAGVKSPRGARGDGKPLRKSIREAAIALGHSVLDTAAGPVVVFSKEAWAKSANGALRSSGESSRAESVETPSPSSATFALEGDGTGGTPDDLPVTGKVSVILAHTFNTDVSPRSIEHAFKVLDDGIPRLVDLVREGRVSVSAAAEVAELPEDEQTELCQQGKSAIAEKARALKLAKRGEALVDLAAAKELAEKSGAVELDPEGDHDYPELDDYCPAAPEDARLAALMRRCTSERHGLFAARVAEVVELALCSAPAAQSERAMDALEHIADLANTLFGIQLQRHVAPELKSV